MKVEKKCNTCIDIRSLCRSECNKLDECLEFSAKKMLVIAENLFIIPGNMLTLATNTYWKKTKEGIEFYLLPYLYYRYLCVRVLSTSHMCFEDAKQSTNLHFFFLFVPYLFCICLPFFTIVNIFEPFAPSLCPPLSPSFHRLFFVLTFARLNCSIFRSINGIKTEKSPQLNKSFSRFFFSFFRSFSLFFHYLLTFYSSFRISCACVAHMWHTFDSWLWIELG